MTSNNNEPMSETRLAEIHGLLDFSLAPLSSIDLPRELLAEVERLRARERGAGQDESEAA